MPIRKPSRDREGQAEAERDVSALQSRGGPFVKAVEANSLFLLGEHADPAMAERFEAAMSAQREYIENLLFRAKNGREIWMAALFNPIVEGSRIVRQLASFVDITGPPNATSRTGASP